MKFASALFASAVLLASAGVAAAGTINLASYGNTGSTPAGASNTALVYYGVTTLTNAYTSSPDPSLITKSTDQRTYDLTTGLSPWAAAPAGSYWVSNDPGNAPGGSNVENSGAYVYFTSFFDNSPTLSSGSLIVLADDTTGVYLNGHQVQAPASTDTLGTCASSQPNCTMPVSVFLPSSDFVMGTNLLEFDVLQEHGSAEGLNFVGGVNVTPEPDSLLLLGTGLAMLAGFTYYRRVQA
jgi:hypothetical protein